MDQCQDCRRIFQRLEGLDFGVGDIGADVLVQVQDYHVEQSMWSCHFLFHSRYQLRDFSLHAQELWPNFLGFVRWFVHHHYIRFEASQCFE